MSGFSLCKASVKPITPRPIDLDIPDGVSDDRSISTFSSILKPSFSIS